MVTTKAKLSTTAKGLGYRHQQATAALKRKHTDGKACDWCGRPMYLDRMRNWDFKPDSTNPSNGSLHGDHSKTSRAEALRLGVPIPLPDRLLHGACNISRGEGGNDHLAAAVSGQGGISTDTLAMAWPW